MRGKIIFLNMTKAEVFGKGKETPTPGAEQAGARRASITQIFAHMYPDEVGDGKIRPQAANSDAPLSQPLALRELTQEERERAKILEERVSTAMLEAKAEIEVLFNDVDREDLLNEATETSVNDLAEATINRVLRRFQTGEQELLHLYKPNLEFRSVVTIEGKVSKFGKSLDQSLIYGWGWNKDKRMMVPKTDCVTVSSNGKATTAHLGWMSL